MRQKRCDQLNSDLNTLVAKTDPGNVARLLLQQLNKAKDAWDSSERTRQNGWASPLRERAFRYTGVSADPHHEQNPVMSEAAYAAACTQAVILMSVYRRFLPRK